MSWWSCAMVISLLDRSEGAWEAGGMVCLRIAGLGNSSELYEERALKENGTIMVRILQLMLSPGCRF